MVEFKENGQNIGIVHSNDPSLNVAQQLVQPIFHSEFQSGCDVTYARNTEIWDESSKLT